MSIPTITVELPVDVLARVLYGQTDEVKLDGLTDLYAAVKAEYDDEYEGCSFQELSSDLHPAVTAILESAHLFDPVDYLNALADLMQDALLDSAGEPDASAQKLLVDAAVSVATIQAIDDGVPDNEITAAFLENEYLMVRVFASPELNSIVIDFQFGENSLLAPRQLVLESSDNEDLDDEFD